MALGSGLGMSFNTHTPTHLHTHILTHTHTKIHTCTVTYIHSLHTHSHVNSHVYQLAHTLTFTHTHTHSPALTQTHASSPEGKQLRGRGAHIHDVGHAPLPQTTGNPATCEHVGHVTGNKCDTGRVLHTPANRGACASGPRRAEVVWW